MAIKGWGKVIGSAINKAVSQAAQQTAQAPSPGTQGRLPSLLAVMAKKKFGRFF